MDEKGISIYGWKVVRTIGKGGFGSVYEVEKDDGIGGVIRSALKVISIPEPGTDISSYRDDGYDDVSLTALFRSQVEDITSEFRLMSKLKGCSNIVSFEDYSIVQHENEPGYDVYIRMELLTPLPRFFEQEITKAGAAEEITTRLGIDICRALELCKHYNIIHRDIKPQNIFVNEIGDYKLGDFGIAKTSDHTTRATKTGTFGYMAPEVYLSKPYNTSVDIYSLGLVMYWMLNERRGPFLPLPPAVPKSAQNAEALDRRMSGDPLPAPKHGSEALKRIVLKACAFDPKDRYASPTEMKRDLERLVVETDVEKPYAETKQASALFAADESEKTFGVSGGKSPKPEEPQVADDEKTFGVSGGKSPKPEEPPVQEDEKTFGVSGGKSPKPEEPQVADDEKTFGVFGGKSSAPQEPQVADDEKTFGVFGGRPTPPKETPVPVSPKKPEPIRMEAAGTEKKAAVPVEEAEKTFGVIRGKPSAPEEPPVADDEKTFGVFGTRQPKEPEFVPTDDEATVSLKKPSPAKPAEKPVEPKKETKPVKTEPEQKTQPVQKETKPVETENRKKKSKLPVILSIAAAVVIAVVLIVVLAGKDNAPSQPVQTAEQPIVTTPLPVAEEEPIAEPIAEPEITDPDLIPDTMTSSDGKYEIAFVTDVGQLKDKAYNQNTWDGCKLYAAANNKSYKYYQPANGDQATDDDRYDAMKAAVDGGAKVIVCAGFMQAYALDKAAREFTDVNFIFIDGWDLGLDNEVGIYFQYEQAGYLAGYAVVMEGYTKLGFCGGASLACLRYGYGFLQGANAAATEKGVDVEVQFSLRYGAFFSASPELQTMASDWYKSGTEVIFVCGGSMFVSVVAAAEENGGKVVGGDVDQSSESDAVITSAMIDLSASAEWAIAKHYDGSWKDNDHYGTSLGAAEDCVCLPTAAGSWRFRNFTTEAYQAIYQKLRSGQIFVSADTRPDVSITVYYDE